MKAINLAHHYNNLLIAKRHNVDLHQLHKKAAPTTLKSHNLTRAYFHILRRSGRILRAADMREIRRNLRIWCRLSNFYWNHMVGFEEKQWVNHFANTVDVQLFNHLVVLDHRTARKFAKYGKLVQYSKPNGEPHTFFRHRQRYKHKPANQHDVPLINRLTQHLELNQQEFHSQLHSDQHTVRYLNRSPVHQSMMNLLDELAEHSTSDDRDYLVSPMNSANVSPSDHRSYSFDHIETPLGAPHRIYFPLDSDGQSISTVPHDTPTTPRTPRLALISPAHNLAPRTPASLHDLHNLHISSQQQPSDLAEIFVDLTNQISENFAAFFQHNQYRPSPPLSSSPSSYGHTDPTTAPHPSLSNPSPPKSHRQNRVAADRQFAGRLKQKYNVVLQSEAIAAAPQQQPKNLGAYPMTPALVSVFAKGPKFVPIPPTMDFNDIHVGLLNFKRAARIFYAHNVPINEGTTATTADTWTPRTVDPKEHNAIGADPADYSDFPARIIYENALKPWYPACSNVNFEAFLDEFERTYLQIAATNQQSKPIKLNLNDDERAAIKTFQADESYVARPEDKGSNFAILRKDEYISKTLATIRDSGFVEVPEFNLDVLADQVTKKLTGWYYAGELSKKIYEALIPKYPYAYKYRAGNQYGQNKTHKKDPTKERIISSQSGTVTEKTSRFVLYHLLPAWRNLPFVIRDSKHLMEIIFRINDDPRIHLAAQNGTLQIFSADVSALYPSVQHAFGSVMTRYCVSKFGGSDMAPHPSLDCIIDLLEFTLSNQISEFVGFYWRSRLGIAQGDPISAQYADFSMHFFDVLVHDAGFVRTISDLEIIEAARFRDDYLFFATGTLFHVQMFMAGINNLFCCSSATSDYLKQMPIFQELPFVSLRDSKSIKFTLDIQKHSNMSLAVNVLDIHLEYNQQRKELVTEVYAKPTDTHSYLPPSSCHRPDQFDGIIKSIALRIRSLCHDDFIDAANQRYKSYLIARGYSIGLVNMHFNYFRALSQKQAVARWRPSTPFASSKSADSTNNSNNKIFLVTKYHPLLPSFKAVITSAWEKWIKPNKRLSLFLPISTFQDSYSRYQNLKEILAPNTLRVDNPNVYPVPTPSKLALQTVPCFFINTIEYIANDSILSISPELLATPLPNRIDGKIINPEKSADWNGFAVCSDLKKRGIITKQYRTCRCFTSAATYYQAASWRCPLTGESIKLPATSCFSRNIVYYIFCTVCEHGYVGKVGAGNSGNRNFRDRHGEHCRAITNLHSACTELEYYQQGTVATDLPTKRRVLEALKQRKMGIGLFTGETLHFCGLDGTTCYNSCGADPLSIYRSFILEQVTGDTRSIIEAKLCEREKYWQAQLCTIYSGFNGVVDFANTAILPRDYKNKVTEQWKLYEKQLRDQLLRRRRIRAHRAAPSQPATTTNIPPESPIAAHQPRKLPAQQTPLPVIAENAPLCICGNALNSTICMEYMQQHHYTEVICDRCSTVCDPNELIFSCPDHHNALHEEGYDLCQRCVFTDSQQSTITQQSGSSNDDSSSDHSGSEHTVVSKYGWFEQLD